LYPYLNNTMPEQVLDKLDDNIPGASGAPVGLTSHAQHSAVPAPTKPSSSGQETVFAQLKSLGELRDSGVLSSEEFDSKKSELLARI
jgi:hypothetical protein